MPAVPAFSQQQLEAIAKLLGDLLTGSEITRVLQQAEVYKDVTPDDTKWKRLLTAFALQQRSDSNGNRVARVIEIAVSPVRYADQPQRFAAAQQQLNRVLAFCGMELGDDGRLRPATPVHTLTEAQRRARNLYQRLADRGVHGQVLSYCTAELLQDNYFHAVLEATRDCSSGCASGPGCRPTEARSSTRRSAARRRGSRSTPCAATASVASSVG
jgi:hypothetical protein